MAGAPRGGYNPHVTYDPDLDAELSSFADALRRLLSFMACALTATRAPR